MVLNPDSCQQRSSSDAERGLDSHERRPSGLMAALRGSQGAGYSVVPAVEGETGSMGNDIPLDPSSSGAHPQWVPISDLDAFFTSMYQYYDEKGFACVVAARLTRLLYARSAKPARPAAARSRRPLRRQQEYGIHHCHNRLCPRLCGLAAPR